MKTRLKSPRSNSEAVRFLHCFDHNLCVFCTSCVPFLVILETIIGHPYPKLTIFGHNLYQFWVPKVSCVPFLVILETIIGHYWLLKPSENEVEVTAQRELSDVVFHLLFFAVGPRPLMKTFCRDFLKIFEQMLGVFFDPQLRKRFQKYRRIMKRYRQCVCIIVCDKIPR